MGMGGLPNMCTQGLMAEGVHIRQASNAHTYAHMHGINVMCHIAPPLASSQVCKPIVFIGRLFGLLWVFINRKLSVHCIYSKGYTL